MADPELFILFVFVVILLFFCHDTFYVTAHLYLIVFDFLIKYFFLNTE